MVVQITLARNERFILQEMLPIWKKYVDGFVFFIDSTTDDSIEYLNSVKDQYNILEIIEYKKEYDELPIETNKRQILFDTARKYTDKIVCLDADEYLDGEMTKENLNDLLNESPDTVFHLQWLQYTSVNTIRIDGPWANNYKDRIGSYTSDCKFVEKQMHSTHLPFPKNQKAIDPNKLFIAHLQWLDKNYVAIKQYFWKVTDYVNNKQYGVEVVGNEGYNQSVNNFDWQEEYIDYELKIREDIFQDVTNKDNYRVDWIINQTNKHNIPNLGNWGYNIQDSIPMYFCTVSDEKHFPILLNMIGSVHKHNFYDTVEIRVYDIGLTESQKSELQNIKKVKVLDVEKTNPEILKNIETGINRSVKGLFSWKPVVIKDSLDHCPYVLYLDAGTTILKPINDIFKHIVKNGYLFFDCGHSIKQMTTKYVIDSFELNSEKNSWIMNDDVLGIDAGFQGVSNKIYDDYVLPMYELSKNIKNFEDDGTCPNGWGYGRHDQTLFSILAKKNNYKVLYHDRDNINCQLTLEDGEKDFHLTHRSDRISDKTSIFRSRWNINYDSHKKYCAQIKRKLVVSCITAIGKIEKYKEFIDQYFLNIQDQNNFSRIQFVIVYSEWSEIFNKYIHFKNIKFVKESAPTGVQNAWNLGIHNADCELITTWNIDDIRYPINNKIKYDLLNSSQDIDLVYNYYVAATPEELRNEVDLSNKPIQRYPDDYHMYTMNACMAGPDPMWRKSYHKFYGLFDSNYSIVGDWEMWIRMSKHGLKFKLIPNVLCIYVEHNNTVSNSSNRNLEDQKIKLMQQYQ